MSQAVASEQVYLVPIAGPKMAPIALAPKAGGLTLGRHVDCDVQLPTEEKVSRFHARFNFDANQWRLADLGSAWGTYLNGVKIAPGAELPLSESDLVRITPWTFAFSSNARRAGMQLHDDVGQTVVRSVAVGSEGTTDDSARPALRDEMLALLLESAAAIHSAQNEQKLADVVMDAAVRGTGLGNAVMLRPLDSSGQIEMIATRGVGASSPGQRAFSQSLIAAASQGQVAEISGGLDGPLGTQDVSHSIVQMKISAAICVPLMLGSSPAAYLYLDSRGATHGLRPSASAFCVALGRMASLALANLKRIDIERRQAAMESELHAAAAAQKWILPKRVTTFGAFNCLGESRPGQFVGGDFFDIIDLGEDRLAVALGDVSGKGIVASVLMTATQGFLHASLLRDADAGRAVTAANRFVNPRRPYSKFVTAWVGVFDLKHHALSYVDAGHSYALLQSSDGTLSALDAGGGMPIGVAEDADYKAETVALPEHGGVLVVSDGIVEQFGVTPDQSGALAKAHFDMNGVKRSFSASRRDADAVAELFAAVVHYAGTDKLSDDATAVLVRW